MAEQPKRSKQELKEEAQLVESINEKLRYLLELKKEGIRLEKHLLKLEEDRLQESLDRGEISEKEYETKTNLVKAEEKILYSIGRGRVPNAEKIKGLISANKELNTQTKLQEKAVTLEKVLDKLGFSSSARMIEMMKGMTTKTALGYITLISMGIYAIKLFKDFQQIDKAAAEFRKTMGLVRMDSERLEKVARIITYDYAHIGIMAEDVYKSMLAITATIGTSQIITREMVEDMTFLSVQLGVAETTSAEFLRVMGQVSQATMNSQTSIALFTAKLSAAAGTNLNEVMGDVATATKSSYQFLTRDSLALAKAAVEARRMGTSLDSAVRTSSFLLDFTRSVNAEMNMSVLVGKAINLQKARELAYHRDIAGLNKEILNILRQTNFENLDPFQQNAVAEALGKSADELAKMAQSDREMRLLRGDDTLRKQVAEYDKLRAANKAMADDAAKSYKTKLEELSNAESLKTITLAIHAVVQKMLYFLLPPIVWILTGAAWVLNQINMGMARWAFILGLVIDYLDDVALWFFGIKKPSIIMNLAKGLYTAITYPFKYARDLFLKTNTVLQMIGKSVETLGLRFKYINVFFRSFGSFFKTIGKVFGEILLPLMFIYHLSVNLWKLWHDPKAATGWMSVARAFGLVFKSLLQALNDLTFGLAGKILSFLDWLATKIFGSLLDPFKRAWHIIKKFWVGESPSQLGLLILEGIVAVEGLILRALISPFKKAWEFIKKLPIISKLMGSTSIGGNISPEAKTAMTVERGKPSVDIKKSSDALTTTVGGMSDELVKRLSSIVDAINDLRTDFKNGSLTANVYIDSQKLDALMGRRLAYTGQLV